MTSLFYCLMPCMLNTFLSHIWPAFTVPPVSKSHCRLSSAASPFTQARTHQICTAVCRQLPLHSHRHAHIKFALPSVVSCHSIHTGTHTSNLHCCLSSAATPLIQARTHQICTAVWRPLPLRSHRHAHIKCALPSVVRCHSIHTGTHTSNLHCRLSFAATPFTQARTHQICNVVCRPLLVR